MNPRVSVFLIFTFILFSCSTEVKEAPVELVTSKNLVSEIDTFYGGGNLLCINDTTEAVFKQFKKIKFDNSDYKNIERDAAFVKRIGDTLFLKLSIGDLKKLVSNNNAESDSLVHYDYICKLENINYYLIFMYGHEWFSYLAVNSKTGKETYLCGEPAVSPNKKYLAASCCDLQAGFVFNGIEMYDVESDSLKLNWKRELTKWGANELAWIDDHNLIVKKQQLDSASQNLVSSYIKLSCGAK